MYAKTLYKPEVPQYAEEIIKSYVKKKVPHFFLYAKNKTESQVEETNNSVVNRIEQIFPKRNLNFNFSKTNLGKFDYRMLLNNPASVGNEEVYQYYKYLVKNLDFNKAEDRLADSDKSMFNYSAVYDDCRSKFYEWGYSRGIQPSDLLDSLIVMIFDKNRNSKKKAFWTMFGDDVYVNVLHNVSSSFARCERCKKRYLRIDDSCVCDKCSSYLNRKKLKIFTCVDCGKVVEIENSKAKRITKRCPECANRVTEHNKIMWRIINKQI